jgi:hypothetical protein
MSFVHPITSKQHEYETMSQLRDPNDKTQKTTIWIRSSLLTKSLRMSERLGMAHSEYINYLLDEEFKRQHDLKESLDYVFDGVE